MTLQVTQGSVGFVFPKTGSLTSTNTYFPSTFKEWDENGPRNLSKSFKQSLSQGKKACFKNDVSGVEKKVTVV